MVEYGNTEEGLGVDEGERKRRREILDKRTGEELAKNWQQQDRAEIEAAEERLAPPIVVEPRCHVCTSEYRVWIERMLVKGYAYRAIASQIPDGKVSRKSISTHYKEHMGIENAAIRAVLEDEADLLRQNYEEGVRGALTHRGMVEVVIRKAYNDVISGVTTAEPRDLVQMVKLLQDMEDNTGAAATEEAQMTIRIFMEAIRNTCTTEIQQAIAAEVRRLRDRDDIEAALESHLGKPPEIPEATVVELPPAH